MTPHERRDRGAHGDAAPSAQEPGQRRRYASPGLSDFGPLRSMTQGGATAVAGDIEPSMRMKDN